MKQTIDVLILNYSALAFSYARCQAKQAASVEAYDLLRAEIK